MLKPPEMSTQTMMHYRETAGYKGKHVGLESNRLGLLCLAMLCSAKILVLITALFIIEKN